MKVFKASSQGMWRALVVAACAFTILTGALIGQAAAHPLGNFTMNRYARVEISADVMRIHYVIDLAEIPSYQARRQVDADPDGYLRREVAGAGAALTLRVEGQRLPLRAIRQELTRPPGQGGLPRVRIDATYQAQLPAGGPVETLRASFTDDNQPDRVGWREIVVTGAGDARILDSSVPSADVSDQLRAYPQAQLQDPLDVRTATFRFTRGTLNAPAMTTAPASAATSFAGTGAASSDPLAALVTRPLSRSAPLVLAGMLGLAALVGAGHALAPGHGKTLMAAYLVGTKGRPKDALLLGLIVAGMHTVSVLLLGLLLLVVDRNFALERLYPILTVVSGLAVAVVGAWLVIKRLRGLGTRHHVHALPEEVAPLSRRGLVLLASAGGVVPSPSAVVAVVSAFAIGRLALGLTLVVAFSVGLAATLTAVGLSLVLGSRLITLRPASRLPTLLPVVAAMVLPLVGVALIVRGLGGL